VFVIITYSSSSVMFPSKAGAYVCALRHFTVSQILV
jgi:hypothetical protein